VAPSSILVCHAQLITAMILLDLRPALRVSLVFVLTVGLTACTTNSPSPQPSLHPSIEPGAPSVSPTTAPMASPTNTAPSLQPSPVGPSQSPLGTPVPSLGPTSGALPDLTGSPPVGDLLVSTSGTGRLDVNLSALTDASKVTIRFACDGSSAARLADAQDSLVMDVSACEGTAIYTTSFTTSASDRVLSVEVDPDVSWEVAVWSS